MTGTELVMSQDSRVRSQYLKKYEIQTVGSSIHQEDWIPAEELPEFNKNIVGLIEVVAEYQGEETG